MSSPRSLSVAMAVHNGMPFIEQSVRSILSQSFSDFEFVIGDDGSSDGTTHKLRELAAQDDRIRVLRRPTASGLAGSRNWVIRETSAPLIAIADADDLSRPDRFQRQVRVLEDRPDAAASGTLGSGIDDQGRIVRPPLTWRLSDPTEPFAPFPHSSVMFRRAAFESTGGYRAAAEYWEDFDFFLRLVHYGPILVLPQDLVSIRHTASSTRLRGGDEKLYRAVDKMYRVAKALMEGRDLERELQRELKPNERLHPRTFVARGSIRLWAGRRPRILRDLIRRARVELNKETLSSFGWALWGEVHPTSLRATIRHFHDWRNRRSKGMVDSEEAIEWRPRKRGA